MPKIILKNSDAAGIIPALTELALGEVAVNSRDGKMYLKRDDGLVESIVEIGANSGGGEASELEKVQETDGETTTTGWRILGRDSLNYGQIGAGAIDLSLSTSPSVTFGATGDNALATGFRTKASGNHSTAIGNNTSASGYSSFASGGLNFAMGSFSHAEGYQTVANGAYSHSEGYYTLAQNDYMNVQGSFNVGASTETIYELGIGSGDYNRLNALEVYRDGRVRAPELTISLHDDPSSLATKEYVDANAGGGGGSLIEVDTGAGLPGWTLQCRIDNVSGAYGPLGRGAVDFSAAPFGTNVGALGIHSFAVGRMSTASGNESFAEGHQTRAQGNASHAEGYQTTAIGDNSHAEGHHTEAGGYNSHCEGLSSYATGDNSHTEGVYNTNDGYGSHAEGGINFIPSTVDFAHVEGYKCQAYASYSHAEGWWGQAYGIASHAEGYRTFTNEDYCHVAGMFNVMQTGAIHETGIGTGTGSRANAFEIYKDGRVRAPELTIALHDDPSSLATKEYVDANAGGGGGVSELEKVTESDGETSNTGWRLLGKDPANYGNIGVNAVDLSNSGTASTTKGATAYSSFAEGYNTTASFHAAHAEGYNTTASGYAAHAEGQETYATGGGSHAEGYSTKSEGYNSHAEGEYSTAVGAGSHAEGNYTTTWQSFGHAEGYRTTAGIDGGPWNSSHAAHAEGIGTQALGAWSHAQNNYTTATGLSSHSEGNQTQAIGGSSHAEGNWTEARGNNSHSEGNSTIALNENSHVAGKFNIGTSTETIHETGVGTSNTLRANAFEIYTDGRVRAPELTIALHDDPSSLATKEYVDANAGGGGGGGQLELVTESDGENSTTGYRLIGRDPAYHGQIGQGAVDLTFNNYATSNSTGATGEYSIAGGASSDYGSQPTASGRGSVAWGGGYYTTTTASGDYSTAFGYSVVASGIYSHAEGVYTTASGIGSRSEGRNTEANGSASHAEGQSTIAQNEAMHAAGKYNVGSSYDTIHETGVGTSGGDRKNAFEIYTDGRVRAPELTIALHDDPSSLATKEYVDANAGGGGASELEKITESDGETSTTGWRILGRNPNKHGNIGPDGIDFTSNEGGYDTSTGGATGRASFAGGAAGVYSSTPVSASGDSSFAWGGGYYSGLTASGDYSAAFGTGNASTGYGSFTHGGYNTAGGRHSHAEGLETIANNNHMHSAGQHNVGTSTETIHETGIGTQFDRKNAFEIYTDGRVRAPELTIALHDDPSSLATKEYVDANASELEKITEGTNTGWRILGRDPASHGDIGSNAIDLSYSQYASSVNGATGGYSLAEGYRTIASGYASHAEGANSEASGQYSHAEGSNTSASNKSSHSEGYYTQASGNYGSHAEGNGTYATGDYSHAEGLYNTAQGQGAHAEGNSSNANGRYSHAEGDRGTSVGDSAHSEGWVTEANGDASHAEGDSTAANGHASHAEGLATIAQNANMHASGKFNIGTSPTTIVEVGIGTSLAARDNAFEVHTDGMIVMPNLPTVDPVHAGALWNDAGTLKISAG